MALAIYKRLLKEGHVDATSQVFQIYGLPDQMRYFRIDAEAVIDAHAPNRAQKVEKLAQKLAIQKIKELDAKTGAMSYSRSFPPSWG